MKISKEKLKELINLIPGETVDLQSDDNSYYGQYLVLDSGDPIDGVRVRYDAPRVNRDKPKDKPKPATVTITVTNKRTL